MPETCRPADLAAAYEIQAAAVALLGGRVAGYKIGATSRKAQAFLGFDQPFSGTLLACDVFPSPSELSAGRFPFCLMEPEFAFKLACDLPDRGRAYEADDLASAVASLHPTFEVVTSAYRDWARRGGPALIADNGAHGALVLGPAAPDVWRETDLADHPVTFTVNGEVRSRGVGRNALGGPMRALAWQANDLIARGQMLKAGQVVSTGVVTDFLELQAGDRAAADFGPFGQVEVAFKA